MRRLNYNIIYFGRSDDTKIERERELYMRTLQDSRDSSYV